VFGGYVIPPTWQFHQRQQTQKCFFSHWLSVRSTEVKATRNAVAYASACDRQHVPVFSSPVGERNPKTLSRVGANTGHPQSPFPLAP
jgi:hypothetical protein